MTSGTGVDTITTVLVQRLGDVAFGTTDALRAVADDINYVADMSASFGVFLPVVASVTPGTDAVGILSGRAGLDGATFSVPELRVPRRLSTSWKRNSINCCPRSMIWQVCPICRPCPMPM